MWIHSGLLLLLLSLSGVVSRISSGICSGISWRTNSKISSWIYYGILAGRGDGSFQRGCVGVNIEQLVHISILRVSRVVDYMTLSLIVSPGRRLSAWVIA